MSFDNKGLRAVFFDLDNTLLDHSSAERDAFLATCVQFGLLPLGGALNGDELYDSYCHINDRLWERFRQGELTAQKVKTQRFTDVILKHFDFGTAYSKQIAIDMSEYYLDSYETFWRLTEGTIDALLYVRQRYDVVGIITNGFVEQQRNKLSKFNWENFFDVVIISGEIGVAKPHKPIFDAALQKAQSKVGTINPSEAVFVGDHHEVDVLGAKTSGWKAIWYNPIGIARPDSNADAIIQTIDELRLLL